MEKTNAVVELLFRHRSIRVYTDESIAKEDLDVILRAAQSGSSSHFRQAGTIIRISDKDIRKTLSGIAGEQSHIVTAPEFWIFLADLHRDKTINHEIEINDLDSALVATIDATIMAQNAVVAAESVGLGCVYVGGIRNDIKKTSELLKLPEHIIPLFGIAMGHPAEDPQIKPRLPKELVFFENHYDKIEKHWVEEYDTIMEKYYGERDKNKRLGVWSERLLAGNSPERATNILPYLHHQEWIIEEK